MLPDLITDQYLAAMLRRPGFELKVNLPLWVFIVVPTWGDCVYLAKHYRDSVCGCVRSGIPLYFEYGGSDRHICQLTTSGDFVDININGQACNRQLLDVFGEMMSSPERSLGLVRLHDERQITVSGGADGKFLCGASVDQTEQWVRADYWHPESLHEFNREWQQQMSVGGGWFEYRYRSFDPLAPAYRRGPEFCDYEFVSRYRLIEGPRGQLFHLAENVDMVAIA